MVVRLQGQALLPFYAGGYAYDRGPTPIAEYARIQNRRTKTKRLRAIRS